MSALDPFSAYAGALKARLAMRFDWKRWSFTLAPAAMTLPEINRNLGTATPGFWLSLVDLDLGQSGRTPIAETRWRLLIVTKHPGAVGARFTGDAAGAGLYPAIATAIALMNGWSDDDLGTTMVTKATEVSADGLAEPSVSLFAIELSIRLSLAVLTEEAEDFEGLVGPDGGPAQVQASESTT